MDSSRGALVLATLVGAGLVSSGVWLAWREWNAASWTPVAGTVLARRIEETHSTGSGRSQGSRMYRPWLRYRYNAGGRTFEGDRIALTAWSTSDRATVETFLAPYPVGAPIALLHDPGDPSRAVVAGQSSWLPGIFAAVGILVLGACAAPWRILPARGRRP